MGLFTGNYKTAEEFADKLDQVISDCKYNEESKMGKFIEKQTENLLNRPKGFRAQDIIIFESYFILEGTIQFKNLNAKINRLYDNLMRYFVDYLKGEDDIKYIRFIFKKENPFYALVLAVQKEDEEERSKAALLHVFDKLYHDDLEDIDEYLEIAKLHCHSEFIEVFQKKIGEKALELKLEASKKATKKSNDQAEEITQNEMGNSKAEKRIPSIKNTVEGDLPIGTSIPTKTDIDNYYGPYSITGAGKVPDGEGKLYEYDDPLGECTYEHVGEWCEGKRHGIFERNKNTGDWENLELYSFDVYHYGKLIDRYYLSDLEDEEIYTKAQFEDYYDNVRRQRAKAASESRSSSASSAEDSSNTSTNTSYNAGDDEPETELERQLRANNEKWKRRNEAIDRFNNSFFGKVLDFLGGSSSGGISTPAPKQSDIERREREEKQRREQYERQQEINKKYWDENK